MLATNIASLVIQHRGGVDPGSFQQLYNTYIFIKVIAIGGYLPITFTLLTLRMLCKMGWLMLTLSIASVGVSIANLFTKRDFSPSQEDLAHLRDVSKTGGPQSCGGHNPIAWCYNRISIGGYVFGDTNEDDGAYNMLIFCLIVLVILTLEHFFSSADATNRSTRNTLLKPLFCWNNRHRRDILAGGKRSTPTSRVLAVMKRFLNLYFSPLSSYSTSTLLRTMPMIWIGSGIKRSMIRSGVLDRWLRYLCGCRLFLDFGGTRFVSSLFSLFFPRSFWFSFSDFWYWTFDSVGEKTMWWFG